MAEALVSIVLAQLVSITREQVEKQVGLVVGVEKEVKTLTFHLRAVQAVLQDAEERQVKEASARNWVADLTDVSYDINDLLDEWNTEILKLQIENQEEEEGENSRQVCLFLPSSCLCLGDLVMRLCSGQIGRVIIMRSDIAKRIIGLNETLSLIANTQHNYKIQTTARGPEQLERLKTTAFVDTTSIVGRENEKDVIIRKLLSYSSQEERGPLVIPIVGMGGMGKTALAQLVYHDEKVKAHFHKRIWVCVSDPFEDIKVAKAIIGDLNIKGDDRINSNELQTLFKCISECIEDKKFLLVLDDVWNPSDTQWEQLYQALQICALGSRIVVTTRKEEVAIKIGAATSDVIHLAELSKQNCLLIFYRIAFFNKVRNDQLKVFEDIGNKLVRKCKGLPLAAKTLGSLMRYKKTKKEWQDVLDSEIWELKEIKQQVFQPLLLSYYDLTPEIKRCLLYCATFPKDYEFDKNNLIELWMSQGYLSLKRDKQKERTIGQIYFDVLVMQSFFQDFVQDEYENIIIGCKMHDIVHDFVQYLTENECLIMEADNINNERNKILNNNVRHLRLMHTNDDSFPVSIYNSKKLRTLIASEFKSLNTISSNLFLQLKSFRTLSLCGCISEVPKEIGGLIHLRYLDLSLNSDLKELPDTVGNLYNLQTLRLSDCPQLKKVPKTIGNLIHLRHFYIIGSYEAELPEDIGKLTSLQRIDLVTVHPYEVDSNKTFKLGNLRNLNQLGGSLRIFGLGGNGIEDLNEAKEAQLVNKDILNLVLYFVSDSLETDGVEVHEDILEGLQPHTKVLQHLLISTYRGTTLHSSWMMSLHNLTSLRLQFCNSCELLPPLGKLASLEIFQIWGMLSVKKLGAEFLGIDVETKSSFPKLKRLSFDALPSWEEWEGVLGGSGEDEEEGSEITIMPSLCSIYLNNCDALTTLPNFLWKTPLQQLAINDCSELGEGREWAKICHIPNIIIDGEFVQKDGVRIKQDACMIQKTDEDD